jgi:hypothetical protein
MLHPHCLLPLLLLPLLLLLLLPLLASLVGHARQPTQPPSLHLNRQSVP